MIEAVFNPNRTSLLVGIIILSVLVIASVWLVYQLEAKNRYKAELKAYKPLVSMLSFFTAFICFGILCFNCWNFISLKPVQISKEFISIKGEQIKWDNILSVDNKHIDEVGMFGNIKASDERILEIRKVGKIQAPIVLSANFYAIDDIYKAIKAKKN